MLDTSPIFCSVCGCRIGWNDDNYATCDLILFCDSCKDIKIEEEMN